MSYPASAIHLTKYADLQDFAVGFAESKFNLLILLGSAGVGKSETIFAAVRGRAHIINTRVTPVQLYCEAYKYQDHPLILDDVDELLRQKDSTALVKALCDTRAIKLMSWLTQNKTLEAAGIPNQFETSSSVCIISNDLGRQSPHLQAIVDRGQTIVFAPNAFEVHAEVGRRGFLNDSDVYAWIEDHCHLITRPSMRHYVRAKELKNAGLDWHRYMLEQLVENQTTRSVANLLSDPRFSSNKQRASEFVQQGHGAQSTFYLHLKRLKSGNQVLQLPSAFSPALLGVSEIPTLS